MRRRIPNPLPRALRRRGVSGLAGLAGLDPGTIESYAQNAGFTGADLTTAVAVALAESGGNPNAYNAETAAGAPQGQGSFGLWQVYLYKHPQFAGQNLYDPQTNANAAYSIYAAAGGFSPWSTYNSGAYLAFVSQVVTPAAAAAPPLTIDATTGLPIDDSPDTDEMPSAASPLLPGLPDTIAGIPTTSLLFLTAAAIGAYLLGGAFEE